jgi:flagellar motor switch protein FliM
MADNLLSQDEINALLNAVQSGDITIKKASTGVKKSVLPYDFKSPNLIPKDAMRPLRLVQENFCRNLGFILSDLLHVAAQVKLVSVDQISYGEFLMSLPEFTLLNLVSIAPLKGNIIMALSVDCLLVCMERMCGRVGPIKVKERKLTELEVGVSSKIVKRILEEYRKAWEHIAEFKPVVESVQSDPNLVRLVKPTEKIVLICCEVKLEEVKCLLAVCFSSFVFEALAEKLLLHSQPSGSQEKQLPVSITQMHNALWDLPLDISAVLGRTTIETNQVVSLKQGDIIQLKKRSGSDMTVFLGSQELFAAKLALKNKRKVAVITQQLSPAGS